MKKYEYGTYVQYITPAAPPFFGCDLKTIDSTNLLPCTYTTAPNVLYLGSYYLYRDSIICPLPTAYCLLLLLLLPALPSDYTDAYCQLPILMPTAYCLLPPASVPPASCLLPPASCLLPGCLLPTVLPDVCCLLPAYCCCLLDAYTACCLLPATVPPTAYRLYRLPPDVPALLYEYISTTCFSTCYSTVLYEYLIYPT